MVDFKYFNDMQSSDFKSISDIIKHEYDQNMKRVDKYGSIF